MIQIQFIPVSILSCPWARQLASAGNLRALRGFSVKYFKFNCKIKTNSLKFRAGVGFLCFPWQLQCRDTIEWTPCVMDSEQIWWFSSSTAYRGMPKDKNSLLFLVWTHKVFICTTWNTIIDLHYIEAYRNFSEITVCPPNNLVMWFVYHKMNWICDIVLQMLF
jgi:hypothetical protein